LYDQEQRRASSGVHLVGRHQQNVNWQYASCVSTKMRGKLLTYMTRVYSYLHSE
jgi:hypothetical protein